MNHKINSSADIHPSDVDTGDQELTNPIIPKASKI